MLPLRQKRRPPPWLGKESGGSSFGDVSAEKTGDGRVIVVDDTLEGAWGDVIVVEGLASYGGVTRNG